MTKLEAELGIYALKIHLFLPGQKIGALYMCCSLSLSLVLHPSPHHILSHIDFVFIFSQ